MSVQNDERTSAPAVWVPGTYETQEIVLTYDNGDAVELSGNVRHGDKDEKYPWYCTFYDYDEGMGFDEEGFNTREEAVLAAEDYFAEHGYAVDKASRAGAIIKVDEALSDGKIGDKDALQLAKLAIRTDQGLYNVRTGTVLMPSVDVKQGNVMGIYRAEVELSDLIDSDTAEIKHNAWKHASFYEPDRWHDGEIGFCPARGEHNAIDYMVSAMKRDGSGWCFADPLAIEAEVGLVPDRYVTVQYEPDGLEEGEQALGWADFLEAAAGNVSYAMSLVDRCDWQFPSTLADEDERNGEVARVGGKLYATNGHDPKAFGEQHGGNDALADKENEARDASQALASVRRVPHQAVREGDAI